MSIASQVAIAAAGGALFGRLVIPAPRETAPVVDGHCAVHDSVFTAPPAGPWWFELAFALSLVIIATCGFAWIRRSALRPITDTHGVPAAQDARVLPITQRGGKRFRTWASVVEDCHSEYFGDWPVRGPRTTKFCMDFMAKRLTPLDHHLLVKSTAKLQAEQWGVQEHELLLRLCEVAGTYDQLDLSNMAWVELALRRVQTIEWVYQEKLREPVSVPGNLSNGMEELAAFAGINRAGEVMMVSPLLLDHVKSEVERDVVVMKNLRKAREVREAKKVAPKK